MDERRQRAQVAIDRWEEAARRIRRGAGRWERLPEPPDPDDAAVPDRAPDPAPAP